jgi:transcriptional regulator with XRE-family HTH domain
MSQEVLAVRAGISQQQVARLELGQRRGRPGTWRRVAAALGVTTELLQPAPRRRRGRGR